MAAYVPFSWEMARDCGFVSTRGEYIRILRDLCMLRAEEVLAQVAARPEQELIQMVHMRDQLDEVINHLSEKALEWHAARSPGFSRKYRALRGSRVAIVLGGSGNVHIRNVGAGIEHLAAIRRDLNRDIEKAARALLPNCTALVGGIVAARLLSEAGGLVPLSRLPAGTIQVLGARTALFFHLTSGTPPPKHGIIYQHRRVHRASRERRGRVARVLAAKLAIAARIDLYRGAPDEKFLALAQAAVERAGGLHDMD